MDITNENEKTLKSNLENVQKMIHDEKQLEALKILLSLVPFDSRNQQDKDNVFSIVMKIMMSTEKDNIKTKDHEGFPIVINLGIKDFVQQLDGDDEKLALMKYVYRGFEKPLKGSSKQLLIWHGYIAESTGVGAIVRVLSDRF